MSRPAILTVDDDPDVLRAVARDLRRRYGKEYRIVRADSGPAALGVLDELASREEPVALLLSDQRMPEMDGVRFLEQARDRMLHSKRVLLTAYADTEAAIDAINRSQVDYYLLKPWDPPEERLYPVLDDLLSDWRAGYRPPFTGIRLVGDRWSPQTHALKDFLARNHVPYRFLDVEESPEAAALAEGEARLPLALLADGRQLVAPTAAELAEALGLRTRAEEPFYDLAIVGGGPAGLASAVYGGSEGLRTVLVEREATGGQAGTSSRIENYLGFPAGLSGWDLARRATDQARRFGVELLTPQVVESLRVEGPYKHLSLGDGSTLSCHVLMLSMGVSWRRLPGTEELAGRGVYYGAAITEAMGCKGESVYVVGAGNSAGQAALYLADFADRVTMLVRGSTLAAKMSSYLTDRIEAHDRIEVRTGIAVETFHGEDRLTGLTLYHKATDTREDVEARYLFAFIGAAPRTDWLRGVVALDDHGFVLTGPDLDPETHLSDWPLEREPWLLETNVPGIFAAGDVRHASIKRVASAVGEGSVAVYFMHRYLESL
ncbi:MAG: FAD-dependent oxidoreductase [Holophagales bacterium]|nr:FAD-dependent oxidoreductase [Holophagales bacterium]